MSELAESVGELLRLGRGQWCEQRSIHRLHDLDGSRGQGCARSCDDEPAGTGVGGVDVASDQAPFLESPDDLGGHFHVGACVRGQGSLRRLLTVGVEPPGAGQQDELDVGETERFERGHDLALPTQGQMPQQKTRALLWLLDHGAAARALIGITVDLVRRPRSPPAPR